MKVNPYLCIKSYRGGGLEILQGKYYDVSDSDKAIIFTKEGWFYLHDDWSGYLVRKDT